MERVAFLVEETGERLGCLLNPDSVVVRRMAGVRPRSSRGGPLAGAGATDDPLLFTGGGRTELVLALLFDVHIGGSTVQSNDVRDLTAPLWSLAENQARPDGLARPPLVRFVWGKFWNVPAVVEAVAERFERFTPEGTPKRSWLSMRLVRVAEPPPPPPPRAPSSDELREAYPELMDEQGPGSEEDLPPGETVPADELSGEGPACLPDAADRSLGSPYLWRLLALASRIADPLGLRGDTPIRVPAAADPGRFA